MSWSSSPSPGFSAAHRLRAPASPEGPLPPPRPPPPARSRSKRWRSSPFFRVGLPFLLFMTLSPYLLSSFLQERYRRHTVDEQWEETQEELQRRLAERAGGQQQMAAAQRQRAAARARKLRGDKFDLQAEYRHMKATLDIDSYEIVRVPRPAEIIERSRRMQTEKQRKEEEREQRTAQPLPPPAAAAAAGDEPSKHTPTPA